MKKTLFVLLPVFLFVAVLIYAWVDGLRPADPQNTSIKIFVINNGESVKNIAARLEENKLIKNDLIFLAYIKLNNLQKKIQAGDFRLSPSFDLKKIISELQHGTQDIAITIPEGLRVEEIAVKIFEKMGIPVENFEEVAREGYMFPDTYYFPKNADAKNIADIIKSNFYKRLSTINNITDDDTREVNGLSLRESIILASIVEREAKYDEDRAIVAGILIKRLKNDWPLEVDATMQYILGYSSEEKKWWRNNITEIDLRLDSPYNTRKYKGLPPKPICSPGLLAIKSVLYPMTSDYWFYLSDKNGKMHYAKTIEEHSANINKYLR